MRIRRKFKKNKKRQMRRRLILAGLIPVALVLLIDSQLRPVIRTMAAYQANTCAVQAVNEAVYAQVAELGVEYGDLVELNTNQQGDVTALQTDMAALNRLQSSITQRIISQVGRLQQESIWVPLGTLIGGPLFSGRGPQIEIRLVPASYIETSVTNVFDSAGINQTRHQVMLNVKMTISAIIPGYSVSTEVSTGVCLAETVIVGLVPQAYTLVGDGTDPMVGLIEDYGAGEQLAPGIGSGE